MNGTIKVSQYLPAFFDPVNIERKEAEASSMEELLAIPFIGVYRDQDPNFFRYSYTLMPAYEPRVTIMYETHAGAHWYVIAFLEEMPPWLDLPVWRYPL